MTGTTGKSGDKAGGTFSPKDIVCRVAYTLNNHQPVSSTIIGEQPLFYMDCDQAVYEDDEGLFETAEEIIALEKEIQTLKQEIEVFDKFSDNFVESYNTRYEKFAGALTDITELSKKKDPEFSLDDLIAMLRKSRVCSAYLDHAKEHEVMIEHNAQVETAIYDRNAARIFINPNIDYTEQLLLAARELRRHWQHRQGALINPLLFHPDNAVLVNRAQEADLTTAIIRAAWELQLSGYKKAWERIENSSMADLGRAFAREAFLDFRSINSGLASTAVFEAWFLSERCLKQDKILIKQMLADYKGYVFDIEQAETSITPTLIGALGSMPFGKNYLAQHAVTIMNDPIFTDVRDRSNANFLWFIKFERTFRETEHDLQTNSDLSTGDIRAPYTTSLKDQGEINEQKQNAEVVQLYAGETRKQSGKREKNNKGADIVYLRRWSGE